jgi:hypothetical protein
MLPRNPANASYRPRHVARERSSRISKVYAIGDADGRVFIVMECVEGETLHVASSRST